MFLPGESQGRGSLVGCHLWGRTESDITEVKGMQPLKKSHSWTDEAICRAGKEMQTWRTDFVDTVGAGEGGVNWKSGADTCAHHGQNRQLVGKCCGAQGAQFGTDGLEEGGGLRGEGNTDTQLIHTVAQQKLAHHCKEIMCVLVTQSYLTLCDPMDCSLPVSSVHGILQARILGKVAISFSRGSSRPRD